MSAFKIVMAVFLAHWFWFVPQTVSGQTDLSEDFVAKGLPASADLPTGDLDRAAESMAQQIAKSDGQSLSVLLAALQTAGFSILDDKGTVLRKPSGGGPGQGLGFYDFEAVGSLKLETSGARVSLAKLAGAITKEVPQIQASQFAELLVTDLRTQANNSNNTYLRFWARLIIELGKYSAQPVDVMTTPASRINLSVLQASLLIRRLQGDVYTLKRKFPQIGMIQPPFSQRPLFVPTFWDMDDDPLLQLVKDSSNSSLPCNLTGDDSLILDAAANGLTFGQGVLMKVLEEATKSTVIANLSRGIGVTNTILAWAKLVAAVAMLKGEIVVDNPPLIRTRNSVPGERRLMTAAIRMDVGKKQTVNCFRTAINIAFGLDFDVPNDGPLADTAITWEFPNALEQSKLVWLEAPEGKNRNPFNQVTNNKGVSQMWLVGAPKLPPVVKKNPKTITKTAHVRVSVRLKSSKDFIQNWIDIGGAALGLVDPSIGGVAGGLVGGVAEIGFRLPYVVARATIPVIDHESFAGYRPINSNNAVLVLSGVICSFEKPFTVTASIVSTTSNSTTYTFVPSSRTAGAFSLHGSHSGIGTSGTIDDSGGSYTIEGADTNTPRILIVTGGPGSVTSNQVTMSTPGGRTGHLDLVPLETDECKEP